MDEEYKKGTRMWCGGGYIVELEYYPPILVKLGSVVMFPDGFVIFLEEDGHPTVVHRNRIRKIILLGVEEEASVFWKREEDTESQGWGREVVNAGINQFWLPDGDRAMARFQLHAPLPWRV